MYKKGEIDSVIKRFAIQRLSAFVIKEIGKKMLKKCMNKFEKKPRASSDRREHLRLKKTSTRLESQRIAPIKKHICRQKKHSDSKNLEQAHNRRELLFAPISG